MTVLALARYLEEKVSSLKASVSMRHPARLYSVAALCATAIQLSCGDSSGPGPVAASLEANSATTFTSPPNAAVSEPPSVIVRDADGDVVAGATVTFAVTAGGGSVTGATQTTNSNGVATVGSWTLGSVAGTNTLTASSGSLTPVVFTANSVDACVAFTPHASGTTTQGALTTADCNLGGRFFDFYNTTLAAGTYLFEQSSNTFDTYLFLLTAESAPVGANDDIQLGSFTDSRIKAILPAGNYVLAATSYDPSTIGSYTLISITNGAGVTNCEDVFVMKGITTAQSLQSTDCPINGYSDDYIIYLNAGQSLTVTMTSTAFDAFLAVLTPEQTTAASNDNGVTGTTDARLTYTASVASFYLIRARSAVSGSTGAYTLVIE